MTQSFYIEIELSVFTEATEQLGLRSVSVDAARKFLAQLPSDRFCLFVAVIEGRRDRGNFYLWAAEERALVRVDDCTSSYARDLECADRSEHIALPNEDGTTSVELYSVTVSREQALRALHFWLPKQELTPELDWEGAPPTGVIPPEWYIS